MESRRHPVLAIAAAVAIGSVSAPLGASDRLAEQDLPTWCVGVNDRTIVCVTA